MGTARLFVTVIISMPLAATPFESTSMLGDASADAFSPALEGAWCLMTPHEGD